MVVGFNLATGDRFVGGKWRECIDDELKSDESLGLLFHENELLLIRNN